MLKSERQFANDGFALWLTGESCKCKSDIHINEWIVKGGKCYIDFGIRVYNAQDVSQVKLYIPYALRNTDIEDLSSYLLKENIAQGIFNAPCFVTPNINKYTSKIEYNNRIESLIKLDSAFFYINELPNETHLTIDLTIIKEYIKENEAYIRFRIPHKSLNNMFKNVFSVQGLKNFIYKITKILINPTIIKDYNYLMNINDIRLLPSEVHHAKGLTSQHIAKVIVTMSLSDNFIVNDTGCYKIRGLEELLYKEYVPTSFKCDNAIVYQWIKERTSDQTPHYNFNFNFKRKYINIPSLLLYSIWVIALSILGNIICNVLKIT